MDGLHRDRAAGLILVVLLLPDLGAGCRHTETEDEMAIDAPRPDSRVIRTGEADPPNGLQAIDPRPHRVAADTVELGGAFRSRRSMIEGARPPGLSSHAPNQLVSRLLRDPEFLGSVGEARLRGLSAEDMSAEFGQLGLEVEIPPQGDTPDVHFRTHTRYHVPTGDPAPGARDMLLQDMKRATGAVSAAVGVAAGRAFLSLFSGAEAQVRLEHDRTRVQLTAKEHSGGTSAVGLDVTEAGVSLYGLQGRSDGGLIELSSEDEELSAALSAMRNAIAEAEATDGEALDCIVSKRGGEFRGRCR